MKKLLLIICMLSCYIARAQYNNEWIDYNKTYYKFPVGKNALNRIPQPALQAIGLAGTPAEQFQLWRNGVQVPIYTSVASGILGGADYLEFWGEMNDGKPDTDLYPNINFQLSDKWSLETDTASYFLTVNPAGNNLRLTNQVNNVAGNVLPAEAYFMYTAGRYFKDRINSGWAQIVIEYVYSSLYDRGEGYTSNDIYPGGPLTETMNNLYPYTSGPNATFTITAAGNAANNRSVVAKVNGTLLVNTPMDSFYDLRQQASFPASSLSSGLANVEISNTSSNPNDRMVVAKYEITYPREFKFGDTSNFVFELPANANGNYLRINFNYGATAPILYDLTNYKRYTGVIDEPGIVKFALLPSAQKRKLVLVSQAGGNIVTATNLKVRNFVDYSQADKQGNYLIISNPLLYTGSNGNAVEAYRSYRSSAAGGSYDARIYDIDQLTDQFAFGIKRHPFAIKKFLKYARTVFPTKPAFVFLIGKGVSYVQARSNETNPLLDQLNLVPTYGYPASDNLLASNDNETIGLTPIGRLSAVSGNEVEIYLNKVKEYESVAVNAPNTLAGRGWMKNIVHAIGGGTAALSQEIGGYMNNLKQIIEDTSYAGNVKSFSKTSAVASQLTSDDLKNLFAGGVGILNYFGHSSSNIIEFNIDDPYVYENKGKYPLFLVNGCLAGDIFNFQFDRLASLSTLSEKYLLAKEKGSIGFVASTHFGIVSYLNIYLNGFYKSVAGKKYGYTLGEILEESFRYLLNTSPGDYLGRLHAEQITLNGDPALKLYTQNLPDYVIEAPMVKLPTSLSINDKSFELQVRWLNIGKGVNDSMTVEIKRALPDGSQRTLLSKRVAGNRYADSIKIDVPINPAQEKGENRIIVTIDSNNEITETSESNNSVTKMFYVIEGGIRPIYPYDFSIINRNNISFFASSDNPVSGTKNYLFEIDTTETFNSSAKLNLNISSSSNILEFKPALSFIDSTVYYWRAAPVAQPGDSLTWNYSSFIYLQNSSEGYSQGHYFQHKKSTFDTLVLNEQRIFEYTKKGVNLRARIGLYPSYTYDRIDIALDETLIAQWMCEFNVLQFVVIDSKTLKPWENYNISGEGRFGSRPICHLPPYSFAFLMDDSSQRRKAMEMLESIPDGNYIAIYWTGVGKDAGWIGPNNVLVDTWKNDAAHLGGKSLYKSFIDLGLTEIDKFTKNVPFLFMLKKGDAGYPVYQYVSNDVDEYIVKDFTLDGSYYQGSVSSPWFGPAMEWNSLRWNGLDMEPGSDTTSIDLYGKTNGGGEVLLKTIKNSHDTSISFVNASDYPYLRLKLNSKDEKFATPLQLKYWRLIGKLPPEGVIYPDVKFDLKDTLQMGEKLAFKMSFKNISGVSFDSLKVKIGVIDQNNNQHEILLPRGKPLVSNDTITIDYILDTRQYPGLNTLFIYFNPDNDQPEQYTFNNFLYKTFYVRPDNTSPLLDVTVDGIHILNNDIISSKPHVLIKLKDDNRLVPLDDTSLVKVQVKYPNGSLRTFSFTSDTLRFTPANLNQSNTDNTATIDFNPQFFEDGDYQLIVSGRDKSGNSAGQSQYTVSFKIINKPMISNMFNYPNPFTTSTAFVFTLTGSEVPQNLRIQVMTITGKIVREITKQELGPIRIGRNITEFKWDGTDQFGQKLANGIYLYRVITNLNGKSLDRYKTEGDNTDQYFNKGYGKMYLMR